MAPVNDMLTSIIDGPQGVSIRNNSGGKPLQTAYSRVTVVTAERTIDLALPSGLPLADVLPQVLRFAAPESTEGTTTSWVLAHLGGSPLMLSQTLGDAGILDGDVLELRAQHDDIRPATVEDVRDAVEDSVDASGGVWSTRTTRSFAIILGSIALLVLALAVWSAGLGFGGARLVDVNVPGTSALAVVVLVFATWWAATFARAVDAQIAGVAAMVWAALFAVGVGAQVSADRWQILLLAVFCVAVVAGVGRLLTADLTGHLAAAAVLLVIGSTYAVGGLSALPADQIRRVLPVLALMVVGAVPLISLSVGGLASADYRVRHVGRLDLATLRARYRASNAVLVGTLIGIALVIVWGGITLDLAGDSWDRTLALSLAAAALLRSRLFSRTQHMLPLRIAGLVVAGFALTRFALEKQTTTPWLVVAVAVIMLAAIGFASLQLSEITRARVKRWLNIVEFLVVVDLLAVLFGALGVYAKIGGVF